eukprot:1195663-Prorocentrum_minimum.AAC.3
MQNPRTSRIEVGMWHVNLPNVRPVSSAAPRAPVPNRVRHARGAHFPGRALYDFGRERVACCVGHFAANGYSDGYSTGGHPS